MVTVREAIAWLPLSRARACLGVFVLRFVGFLPRTTSRYHLLPLLVEWQVLIIDDR